MRRPIIYGLLVLYGLVMLALVLGGRASVIRAEIEATKADIDYQSASIFKQINEIELLVNTILGETGGIENFALGKDALAPEYKLKGKEAK